MHWRNVYRAAALVLMATVLASAITYEPPQREIEPWVTSTGRLRGVYEGLIYQEDDPLHDWDADHSGPKVLSLDVTDPVSAEYVETYILTNSSGGFYRIHPRDSRSDPVWGYWGTKPVKVTGNVSEVKDYAGRVVKTLRIEGIEYSSLGGWYRGVLSRREYNLMPYTFYKSGWQGSTPSNLMVSFKILDNEDRVVEEVPLASHEGYLYYIPGCGTGQPIAMFRFNQTVRVYGLMMPIKEASGTRLNALMVFDATQSIR
ncbi:MAG: hypothetical protein V1924_04920 [Candidatus Bathyarchaeota archaeon]